MGLEFLVKLLTEVKGMNEKLRSHRELLPEGESVGWNIDEALEVAQDSYTSSVTALQTLNDLLLYDKIADQMLQLEVEQLPTKELFGKHLHPVIWQIETACIDWEIDVSAVERTVMVVDQVKMTQVIRNFLLNALKFTPAKGKISLTASLVECSGSSSRQSQRYVSRPSSPPPLSLPSN